MSEFTTQGRAEEMPNIHNEILHCKDYELMNDEQILERRDYFRDLMQHPLVNDRQTEELENIVAYLNFEIGARLDDDIKSLGRVALRPLEEA